MAIMRTVQNKGDQASISNQGSVIINQTQGQIAIRKGVKRVVEIDADGFAYFDADGVRRISLGQNEAGLEQIVVYGADGKAQIVIGQNPRNGEPVIAVSKNGADVLEALRNV